MRVTNFRSAEDSGTFGVEQVTCLVGKNEAGKSAVLLALAALNPHPETPAVLDKERDYPRRHLTQYEVRHADGDAVAVTTTWRLEPEDKAAIAAAVGEGVVTADEVTVSRSYGHEPAIGVGLSFGPAMQFLFDKFQLDESERAVLSAASTTSQLIEELPKLASPTARHAALQAHLAKVGHATGQVQKLIQTRLPKFMYVSAYDRMDGAIQIEHTQQLINNGQLAQDVYRGERLFAEFLDYAGVPLDAITSATTYETFNARLEAASNAITDQVLEYWTQNPDLGVAVRVEQARPGDPAPFNAGTIARARIDNALHRVNTPFSERSAGFVWFFSFLVKFARVKEEGSSVILLLDEPGLTLHGKAQADLLRFFAEKLAPHHQIVYSTHSPFMVPADDLASVRVVEDQVDRSRPRAVPLGTKVRDDVLTRDPDTLFPLQGALGYEITQSLFVGANTLLVEGPGDILYLQALSDALVRRGRRGLDPRWTLCPAGGIDKIRPFVSLFSGNAVNVAVLSDEAKGDKRRVEELRRSEVLKAGQLRTMAEFLDRSEADIEDAFEPEVFVAILNGCYSLQGEAKLTVEQLRAADPSTERLVKQAEAAFRVTSDATPMLDHFTPAAWLIRNPKVLDGKAAPVARTLDRAAAIFAAYDGLLETRAR